MEPIINKPSSEQESEPIASGCPFLGLNADLQSYFSTPNQGNHCHKVNPPTSVLFDHQENFCLSRNFFRCEIYNKGLENSAVIVVSDLEQDGIFMLSTNQPLGDTLSEIDNQIEVNNESILEKPLAQDMTSISSSDGDATRQGLEAVELSTDDDAWKKLHEEVKQRYTKKPLEINRRYLVMGSLIFSIIVISVLGLWIFNKFSEFRSQYSQYISESTSTRIELEMQGNIDVNPTETGILTGVLEEIHTTSTLELIENDNEIEKTQEVPKTATLQPTATQVVSCLDFSGYPIDVVSGPDLTPKPGYIYKTGSPEPFFQVSWLIKNAGTCTWDEILLREVTDEKNITPIIKMNNQIIDLANPDQTIKPGDEIEIILRFRAKEAKAIDRDWVFFINGINLSEQLSLELNVKDWVTIVQ